MKEIRERSFRKGKSRRIQVDYACNMAFEFLYLFEEHCPKSREVASHIRAIESILQSKFFINPRDCYMDEINGYKLYLTGYDYDRRDIYE